jgi:hypothetical protein
MKPKTSDDANRRVAPGRHTSILRHGEEYDAIRHVTSSASPVSVFAGPSSKVKELVEFGNLDGRALAYLHCSTTIRSGYIGHSGNGERRLGEQVKARPHFDELFVVCFKDPSIGMTPARYAEARFIQLADEAGSKLDNVDRPAIPDMTESERADHERLLHEMFIPLRDAGCRILEKRLAPATTKNGKSEPADAHVVFGPIKIPLNAQTFELNARAGMSKNHDAKSINPNCRNSPRSCPAIADHILQENRPQPIVGASEMTLSDKVTARESIDKNALCLGISGGDECILAASPSTSRKLASSAREWIFGRSAAMSRPNCTTPRASMQAESMPVTLGFICQKSRRLAAENWPAP